MIRYLIGVFCLLLSIPALAQIDANYNYTIGLRAYNLMQMPKILNQTNAQNLASTVGNGILVKFNDNQIGLRLGGSYYYNGNTKFPDQCESCQEANGKVTDYSFKLGFEKNLNYAVVQPYFGFDLGYRSNAFSGEVRPRQNNSAILPYNVERTKSGITLSPLLGIKFNVVPQLSIYTESSLDFYFSYESRETISQAPGKESAFSKFNRLEYLLNAIGVGLQFHFGQKN